MRQARWKTSMHHISDTEAGVSPSHDSIMALGAKLLLNGSKYSQLY